MGNRTLIRPDGSSIYVTNDEAEKLLTLGYKEQTPEQEATAAGLAGTEAFYSSPLERGQTVAEGLLSGMSLGLTDLGLSDAAKDRARYNPGTRLASELAGGLVGGLGPLKAVTPVGRLISGAEKVGEAVGKGSRTISALTRGAVEGGGFGLGSTIANAQVTGDPLTAESISAGIGWGALFGGGLSALGAGVANRMELRAAKKADIESKFANIGVEEQAALSRAESAARVHGVVSEGVKSRHMALGALEDGHYDRLATAVQDAVSEFKIVSNVVEDAKKIDFTALKRSQNAIYSQLADNMNLAYVRPEARAFVKHFSTAQLAAKEGKFQKMVDSLEKFKENMAHIETKLGGPQFFSAEKVVGQANDLIGTAKYRLESSVKAAEDLAQMEAIRSTLKTFPKTADEFLNMNPTRAERLSAAVDELGNVKAAELEGVKVAVHDAIEKMSGALGITIEGTPGQQLAGMWKGIKKARSLRASEDAKMGREGNLLWNKVGESEDRLFSAKVRGEKEKAAAKSGGGWSPMHSSLRYVAGSYTAQKLGGGPAGYALGAGAVSALLGMKGAILGTIAEKASLWVPKAARTLEKFGPRAEPLATRIDGTFEVKEKDRRKLMEMRMKEIAQAAPGVRDTLYRGVEPLTAQHPELAAQMLKHNVARFQFILGKMPKDPGLAFSNLKSIWKPDPVAVEKFARYYEVFHDPVGVMTRALKTGKVTMEAAEGLREMDPELFQVLRMHMLEHISDPKVAKKMKYEDQVHLGLLLDLPIHSTMDPRFVSAQQQMYTERNKPLEMNPRIQPGGGAGRPSGPGPGATAGQKITEH